MQLEDANHEQFRAVLGDTFAVDTEGVTLELTAVETKAPQRGAQRTPFVLTFRATTGPILPQRIYQLEHPQLGAIGIFLVPVDRTESHVYYEAVFT